MSVYQTDGNRLPRSAWCWVLVLRLAGRRAGSRRLRHPSLLPSDAAGAAGATRSARPPHAAAPTRA